MKTYRVWEANRKIFLYPENWIEPELRDDKSPFFKDLENELLQNEITSDNAETAFLHYLEKLDQVARLEIMGMYSETDRNVLHVFGRTYSTPHLYYYRRKEGQVWTLWEKVDLDIEGDHLIPVVWNNRLYLFWPMFRNTSGEAGAAGGEIALAWSEYRGGKWSPKKVSNPLTFEWNVAGEVSSYFYFRAGLASQQEPLLIDAYREVADSNPGDMLIDTLMDYEKDPLTHQRLLHCLGSFRMNCRGELVPQVSLARPDVITPLHTNVSSMSFQERDERQVYVKGDWVPSLRLKDCQGWIKRCSTLA